MLAPLLAVTPVAFNVCIAVFIAELVGVVLLVLVANRTNQLVGRKVPIARRFPCVACGTVGQMFELTAP